MRIRRRTSFAFMPLFALFALGSPAPASANERSHTWQTLRAGQETFRFDTFGDEAFWGDALGLHLAIEGAANGGVGDGLTPRKALELGLKVDVEKLPGRLRSALRHEKVDLDDPAVTLLLLRLDAIVGVTGFRNPGNEGGALRSVGIQCALCHSTVDDSLIPGVGRRLDGWANRDLDVGGVILLAPNLTPYVELLGVDEGTVRRVFDAWGPGKFDALLTLDGLGFTPEEKTAATLIPPAFGLAGVNNHTWTGSWGTVTYWNAFVAVLEMHGKGNFFDPRLDDAGKFPVAARNQLGHVTSDPDLVTPKLAALHAYQLSLRAPKPPKGSFDAAAAARGKALFSGKADCARCHVPPLYTEPGWNLHTPEEIGIDGFQASRSPDGRYRTAPLAGLWTHQTGGFYHDGRFATLLDVVSHYDMTFTIGLSDAEKSDLVEFLKSL